MFEQERARTPTIIVIHLRVGHLRDVGVRHLCIAVKEAAAYTDR